MTLLTIVSALILTIVIVYPINEVIMAKAGAGKSAEEIKRMVHTWILADRVRFAIIFVGYLFLLGAFHLPIVPNNSR